MRQSGESVLSWTSSGWITLELGGHALLIAGFVLLFLAAGRRLRDDRSTWVEAVASVGSGGRP